MPTGWSGPLTLRLAHDEPLYVSRIRSGDTWFYRCAGVPVALILIRSAIARPRARITSRRELPWCNASEPRMNLD
jgi:hypothetical protein